MDLRGKSQTVRSIYSAGVVTALPGTGGEITDSRETGAPSDFVLVGNSTRDFGGRFTGNLNLIKAGDGSLTLRDDSNFRGAAAVLGGVLSLVDQGSLSATSALSIRNAVLEWDDTGLQALQTRVNPNAPITLDGGAFSYISRSATDGSIRIGSLALAGGANLLRIQVGGNSPSTANGMGTAEMWLAGITSRAPGSTLTVLSFAPDRLGGAGAPGENPYFKFAPGFVPQLTNGILGGWALASGADALSASPGMSMGFATYDPAAGLRALPAASYTSAFAGSSPSSNLSVASSATMPAGGATINSLTFSTTPNSNVGFLGVTDRLTLLSGGIVSVNTTSSASIRQIGSTTIPGQLTSGAGELFLHHAASGYGSPSFLNVNSQITGDIALVVDAPAYRTSAVSNVYLNGGNFALAGAATTAGSTWLTLTSGTGGLARGMAVSGPFIPEGTTILDFLGTGTLVLSRQATGSSGSFATTAAVSMSAQSTLTLPSTAGLAVGMGIAGAGIPAGTIITQILDNANVALSAAGSVSQGTQILSYWPLVATAGPGNNYTGTTYFNGTSVLLNAPVNAVPGSLVLSGATNWELIRCRLRTPRPSTSVPTRSLTTPKSKSAVVRSGSLGGSMKPSVVSPLRRRLTATGEAVQTCRPVPAFSPSTGISARPNSRIPA